MLRPKGPWPTSTTCRATKRASVTSGSSASGSSRASSRCAKAERVRIQRCAGPAKENTSGLSAIEISAPATIRFWPSTGNNFSDTPSAARMKENSPIGARLVVTVRAVLSG